MLDHVLLLTKQRNQTFPMNRMSFLLKKMRSVLYHYYSHGLVKQRGFLQSRHFHWIYHLCIWDLEIFQITVIHQLKMERYLHYNTHRENVFTFIYCTLAITNTLSTVIFDFMCTSLSMYMEISPQRHYGRICEQNTSLPEQWRKDRYCDMNLWYCTLHAKV